ncbi:MAG: peptide chain release factor N(5)-glutamine methyltransferase [Bacillus sp. (in: Bacteria)]|nr:peptide chain release factor N(5)-glutamine methyltransferase [Bacillus sp. (in: firmicutes)]MCM1427847.1 peptide chain release factor N(5)-glutamine methyltransferase [Eubacterium sp.]
MEWNYRQAYEWGVSQLQQAEIPEAETDARLLLEAVCKTDRNTLLAHGEREVSAEEQECYVNYIAERKTRRPLQYITGIQEFMGLPFFVDGNVLIPRQDTEILVEEVMRHLHDGMRILDMCTGSGCILLSLLYYSNDCTGLGIDISGNALQIAGKNAEKIRALKEDIRVSFLQGDLFEPLAEKKRQDVEENNKDTVFEIIVSNPPYIQSSVIDTLMPEVREFEPRLALDGKEDGLYFYRRITEQAGNHLAGGGALFFEIGYDEGEAVKEIMTAAGYKEVQVVKDFAGLDRVVYGTLP